MNACSKCPGYDFGNVSRGSRSAISCLSHLAGDGRLRDWRPANFSRARSWLIACRLTARYLISQNLPARRWLGFSSPLQPRAAPGGGPPRPASPSHGDQPAALRRLCSPTSHPGHGPFDPLPASFAQYVQVILSHPIWVTADLSSQAARMTPRDINRFQAVLLLQCLGDNLYKAHSVVSLARGRTITWAIPICLILSAPRRARGWRERRRESAAWTTSPGECWLTLGDSRDDDAPGRSPRK